MHVIVLHNIKYKTHESLIVTLFLKKNIFFPKISNSRRINAYNSLSAQSMQVQLQLSISREENMDFSEEHTKILRLCSVVHLLNNSKTFKLESNSLPWSAAIVNVILINNLLTKYLIIL